MKTNRASQSAFINLRVLIGLFIVLAGVFLAVLGLGVAQAQQKYYTHQSTDPLVPADFDCSRIDELGIDKQENLRAGAIMIACGEAEGGAASPLGAFFQAIKKLVGPLAYGTTDVNLITGTETSPNITQSETFTAGNPDNPLQIIVAYNDSRGRNAIPINISGASVSTDGGNTFVRLTPPTVKAPSPIPLATPLFCTTNQPALGIPSGSTGAAALRASAGSSPPLHRTHPRLAGPTIAFTPAAATTASPAGPTTTRAAPSLDACTSP